MTCYNFAFSFIDAAFDQKLGVQKKWQKSGIEHPCNHANQRQLQFYNMIDAINSQSLLVACMHIQTKSAKVLVRCIL